MSKPPATLPPSSDYIQLQRAKSFARKREEDAAKANGFLPESQGFGLPPGRVPVGRPPSVLGFPPSLGGSKSDLSAPSMLPPGSPSAALPDSKPPDMEYIAMQRAQSFARKRASAAQATAAAAALGSRDFLKEALVAAGGENNTPAGPPRSLLAKHPSLLLQYRPANGERCGDAPKRLEIFAARAQSEPLRLLLEATCTPYDLHIHFFGESANPADYQSRAGPLAELPLYKGDELGDASICGCKAILRHLGRTLEGSLCGEEDDLPAQAEVDQLLELSFDMLDAMQGFRGGSTSSKDGEFVKPGWWSLKRLEDSLRGAEKMLPSFLNPQEGVYFVAGALSLADIGMLHALSTLDEMKPGWLAAQKVPKLVAFLDSHRTASWYQEYASSPRRLPACPIDFDFNLLHADWHPRHYEYTAPLEAATAGSRTSD